jgi:hypothetical protein
MHAYFGQKIGTLLLWFLACICAPNMQIMHDIPKKNYYKLSLTPVVWTDEPIQKNNEILQGARKKSKAGAGVSGSRSRFCFFLALIIFLANFFKCI